MELDKYDKEIIGKIFKAQNEKYGNFEVLELFKKENRSRIYKIRFLNTGNEHNAYRHHILSGSVADIYSSKEEIIGKIFKSKNYGEFKVLKFVEIKNKSYYYEIKFLTTGTVKTSSKGDILSGNIYDPNYSSVYKIGYMGEGMYSKKEFPYIYNIWQNMLERCYSVNSDGYVNYGLKGYIVCEEWHNFQNFAEWFEPRAKAGYELDKDIICNIKQIKDKIYSPETCILLPSFLNCYLAGDKMNTGIFPKMGEEDKQVIYEAIICINYKSKSLGIYNTFEEAKIIYAKEKQRYWLELLENHRKEIGEELYNLCLQYDFSHGILKQ